MDFLKKFFPLSFKATDIKPFVITLIIYVVVEAILGVILGLIGKLPLLGIVCSLIGSLIGLYSLAGIVLAILVFTKVIK